MFPLPQYPSKEKSEPTISSRNARVLKKSKNRKLTACPEFLFLFMKNVNIFKKFTFSFKGFAIMKA